ncbi:MAG: Crp/Fnr family transcriptional regulator [Rikenellaceae bacterium]|nr:Crp/Fnr family transcriptional regulator [Rikenellaceae bacterium]
MYDLLTACPLFRGLTADQIRGLIEPNDNHTVTRYAKGDLIARRDTAYSGLMIILKGRVTGLMTDAHGRQLVIDTLEAPQLIAPAFLFGGYNRLPIDIVADEQVDILTLHRGFVFEMMQENVLILSNFIDIISNRANVWSKKIYFLSFKSLKQKVALYLLDHTSESNAVVPVPDIREIAEFFEATRSSLTAVLEDLQKKHLVRCDAYNITVLSREGLGDLLK